MGPTQKVWSTHTLTRVVPRDNRTKRSVDMDGLTASDLRLARGGS